MPNKKEVVYMALTSSSGRIFENSLREMANEIVWHNKYDGDRYEQASYVDPISVDIYLSGARYLLMYYSKSLLEDVEDYSVEEYLKFRNSDLITSLDHIRYWDMFFYGADISPNINKNNNTGATKDELLNTPKYEERNKYYRMLYGLPEYGKENLKYAVYYPEDPTNLSNTTYKPLYEFPSVVKIQADRSGFISDKIEQTKIDRSYDFIKYMTQKRIHPFVARLSGRFELLYIPETEIANLSNDFRAVYEECTTFMIYHYYSEAYRNQYESYEGFIAMSILFMTLQMMQSKYLEADITRDFYDLDSIKVVYDAYSVPFFETIPVSYHTKIIKAINRLLSYKGSDRGFREIFAIFGYNNLNIYQYYLLRQHKLDDNGNPLFIKNILGEYDNEKMFDVKFVKADIAENPYKYIVNSNNDLNYWGVSEADPYWVNDRDLLDKLYNSDYNFIETKYIGVELVFSLTRYILETNYFMRMLLDNRDLMSILTVSHGKLGIDIDLFTLVIYINAIVCMQLGLAGDLSPIFEEPSKLSAIYGYNFIEDLKTVYPYIARQVIFNNDIPEENSEIKRSMQRVRDLFINVSREEREFIDFVNGRHYTMSYTDEVCCVCQRPRNSKYPTYCHHQSCWAHVIDMSAFEFDEETGIAGDIHTIYNTSVTYDNRYMHNYVGLYSNYEDIVDKLRRYINNDTYEELTIKGDFPIYTTYDDALAETNPLIDPSTVDEDNPSIQGEPYMIPLGKYKVIKHIYGDIVAIYRTTVSNISPDESNSKAFIWLNLGVSDSVNYDISNVNYELPPEVNNMHSVGNDKYSDADMAKIVRVKRLIKNYITGITDVFPLEIFQAFMSDYDLDIRSVKAYIKSQFDDPSKYSFDDIIRKYFLNENYIKTTEWGIADGHVSGRDPQSRIETDAHRIIVNEILKIINTDMKLGHNFSSAEIEDINTSYNAIKDLQEVFTKLMWQIKEPKTYYAAKRIEKMLMTTYYSEEIYRKKNGDIAVSYRDLLTDLNPILELRIADMGEKQLLSELDYSLSCLQKLAENLMYIQSYGAINTNKIIEYIYSLLKFFKSAKAELIDFNMQYSVDGKSTNLLKLMGSLTKIESSTGMEPDYWQIVDYVRDIYREIYTDSGIKLSDICYHNEMYINIQSPIFVLDTLSHESVADYFNTEYIELVDHIFDSSRQCHVGNKFTMIDKLIKL